MAQMHLEGNQQSGDSVKPVSPFLIFMREFEVVHDDRKKELYDDPRVGNWELGKLAGSVWVLKMKEFEKIPFVREAEVKKKEYENLIEKKTAFETAKNEYEEAISKFKSDRNIMREVSINFTFKMSSKPL